MTSTKKSQNYIPIISNFLKPSITIDKDAELLINRIFTALAAALKKNYDDFILNTGYLGEAAAEAADRHTFVDKPIVGLNTVAESNVLVYIAKELFDLLNNALRDSRQTKLTSDMIARVIQNDPDLNISFNLQ